jgi:glycosyltransferase involved in cell wall biosynthesis
MLIGIDASRSVTQQRTGTEAYTYFLIKSLISQTRENGYDLRLYFNEPPPANLFAELPHVEFRVMPFARLWTHVRLARELRHDPPDVFFTPAHVIPFIHRGAAAATVHDLGYHYFPEAHTASQAAYLKLSTRANSLIARELIADSAATKRDLVRFYGTDPARINVVYPGLDPELRQVSDLQEIARACTEYRIEGPYLLYMGTLQPRKNLKRLVQAFALADLPHQLVLAGKTGWQTEELFEELAALDSAVRARVLLPGFVPESRKAALLSGAAALVYPSLYEGFGFPVLEAQACGIPVLAANSSSLPEISGGGALLVDPLDVDEIAAGMQQIAGDNDLRQALVANGQTNVQRFSWDQAASAVLRILEKAAR